MVLEFKAGACSHPEGTGGEVLSFNSAITRAWIPRLGCRNILGNKFLALSEDFSQRPEVGVRARILLAIAISWSRLVVGSGLGLDEIMVIRWNGRG